MGTRAKYKRICEFLTAQESVPLKPHIVQEAAFYVVSDTYIGDALHVLNE